MRWRLLVPIMVAVTVAGGVAGYALDVTGPRAGADVLGPGEVSVELGIEHSRFSFDGLQVRPGTTVRFRVRNTDPIAHELIIGDDELHRRHATGTEAFHPPAPGEVSVGPHETGLTTYTFDQPGTVLFACHLPGHLGYGMKGVVVVTGD